MRKCAGMDGGVRTTASEEAQIGEGLFPYEERGGQSGAELTWRIKYRYDDHT